MTTPAPKPISAAALAAGIIAIARHITGTPAGDEHQALTALGVSVDHAANLTGKTPS